MAAKFSTPELRQDNPMHNIVEKAGLKSNEPVQGVVILSLPGADDEMARRFAQTLELLKPYMPFNVAITYQHVSALSKDDILDWKEKIDSICKSAGWLK